MGKLRRQKCLVIDTDIARAAGQKNAQEKRATGCRDFLQAMLDETEHKVVFTKAIRDECNKHQSKATLIWHSTMIARKRVYFVDASVDRVLRQKVERCTSNESKRMVMLKDIHLLEAAFRADKTVISMDETVRDCFHEVTGRVGVLKQIIWVNPDKSEETAIEWLRDGAEQEEKRMLGYYKKQSEI